MPRYAAQTNLTAGELSPQLEARLDFNKYQNGAELLRNFVVRATGGVTRRAGSYFISEVYDSDQVTTLVPFIFSQDQAYILELSNGIMRIYRNRRLLKTTGDGTEKVTNGGFTGGTGWTSTVTGTGAITFPTAFARLNAGASGTARLSQSLTLTDDADYRFEFTVIAGLVEVSVGTTLGADDLFATQTFGVGSWAVTFPTVGTTAIIQFATSLNANADLDAVSVEKALTLVITTPWTTADIKRLRWAQSGDVLYFGGVNRSNGQPFLQPYKLLRITLLDWELRPVNFSPVPSIEAPMTLPATLTPGTGATTVGTSVTFTAGSAVFLAGDQYKILESGAGRASITAVATGGGSVTATIIDAFSSLTAIPAGSWTIFGSPSVTLTPNATGPKGAIISLTAGGDAFRSSDLGSFVRGNGGLAQILQVVSATSAGAQVVRPFTSTSAIGAGAWTLEVASWSSSRGWPEVVAFYEQRSIWAASASEPLTFWGSVTGDFENFALGPNDDDAIDYAVASGYFDRIRWLIDLRSLLIGTPASEFSARGGTDTPLTATSAKVQPQTTYGCDFNVAPIIAGYAALFLQRGAQRVRELTYDFVTDSYQAPDLSILAEHLFANGITALARMSSPLTYLFALQSTGVLNVCAYNRTESVVGWSRFVTGPFQDLTDGRYESVAVIPSKCGGADEVWVVAIRQIGGQTVRYVEVFDGSLQTDSARVAESDTPFGSVEGLDHLEGQAVSVVTAEQSAYTLTVATGGTITLPDSATSTRLEVGLRYGSTLRTLRPELPTQEGTSQTRIQRVDKIAVRFACTGPGCQVGDEDETELYTPTAGLRSEDYIRERLGWDRTSRVVIDQQLPFAVTVLGIVREYEVGEGQ